MIAIGEIASIRLVTNAEDGGVRAGRVGRG